VSHYTGAVLKELDRAFNQGTISGLTEGNLLEGLFRSRRGGLRCAGRPFRADGSGDLPADSSDESDVDDAFQATFLVLVRRAGAIRPASWSDTGSMVSPIGGVRARALAARRRVHEPTGLQRRDACRKRPTPG